MSFPLATDEAMVRPPQAAVSKTGDKVKIFKKTLDFLRSAEFRLLSQMKGNSIKWRQLCYRS